MNIESFKLVVSKDTYLEHQDYIERNIEPKVLTKAQRTRQLLGKRVILTNAVPTRWNGDIIGFKLYSQAGFQELIDFSAQLQAEIKFVLNLDVNIPELLHLLGLYSEDFKVDTLCLTFGDTSSLEDKIVLRDKPEGVVKYTYPTKNSAQYYYLDTENLERLNEFLGGFTGNHKLVLGLEGDIEYLRDWWALQLD